MSTLRPGTTLTIADLFRALDVRIADEISLARSVRPGQNPFSQQVVSLCIYFPGTIGLIIRQKLVAARTGFWGAPATPSP